MQDDHAPLLRWVFARHAERVQCELSIGHPGLLCEVRTLRLGVTASEVVEHYRDVSGAFHRQGDIEQALLDDGWSLEHYETLQRACPA